MYVDYTIHYHTTKYVQYNLRLHYTYEIRTCCAKVSFYNFFATFFKLYCTKKRTVKLYTFYSPFFLISYVLLHYLTNVSAQSFATKAIKSLLVAYGVDVMSM